MAWLFYDEATPKTVALPNGLATETALVPGWWFIEITNDYLDLAVRRSLPLATLDDDWRKAAKKLRVGLLG